MCLVHRAADSLTLTMLESMLNAEEQHLRWQCCHVLLHPLHKIIIVSVLFVFWSCFALFTVYFASIEAMCTVDVLSRLIVSNCWSGNHSTNSLFLLSYIWYLSWYHTRLRQSSTTKGLERSSNNIWHSFRSKQGRARYLHSVNGVYVNFS